MLTKRIIPCLDIKNGRTVKGVNFEQIRDAGDPVELGKLYAEQGADELVFLDITATQEKRKTFAELVREIAQHLNIPFTVGGGINSVEDAEKLLEAGADKVSINSSAVRNPKLINQMAEAFGSQFVVVAIDGKQVNGEWEVFVSGGKIPTGKEMFAWAKEAEERGSWGNFVHFYEQRWHESRICRGSPPQNVRFAFHPNHCFRRSGKYAAFY